FKYDAIIVLDSADKYRLGPIVEQIDFSKSLANIDHHISNAYFGTLNIVKPNLSSTCEIVYEIIKDIINIDKDIATYLYLGILTDTGSFRYANTNANSLRSASELLTYGVDASLVSERVWFRDSLNRIKLLGDVLETLVVEDGFSLMWVNQDMMKKRGANEEDTEEFVNYGLTLDGVRVAAILKERAGRELKISLRSKKGTDVNLIAKEYGGGGHQNAAGFTVKNKTITEFMPELKKKIKGLI
ncbi:MAG TPA: bifunctional oligoribonuclease/PAP phosphatase NrnA, partial [candidate division WOR-3 bacterium]|nr:bifunctional oligoribonuclease/PAP phosphatase NrnA [candidate division WOR-3 bacterium]